MQFGLITAKICRCRGTTETFLAFSSVLVGIITVSHMVALGKSVPASDSSNSLMLSI